MAPPGLFRRSVMPMLAELQEYLDSLIFSHTEFIIKFCGILGAVLGSLPEQALIITQERTILHPLSSLRR